MFPRPARNYASAYALHFVGWFNVTEGSSWDNVIILDLPNYAVLDKLYADAATNRFGHRVAEMIFDKQHTLFLRERMGPDFVFKR